MANKGKRRGRKLDAQARNARKHQVSLLKKVGVFSPKINAASRLTDYRLKTIRKLEREGILEDVIAKRIVPVPVKRDARNQYKEARFPIVGSKVFVQNNPDEILGAKDGGLIRRRKHVGNKKTGFVIDSVILPASIHNLDDFLRYARQPENMVELERGSPLPNKLYAFRYLNGYTMQTFVDLDQLADELMFYIERTSMTTTADMANEVWDKLEIVSIRDYNDDEWTAWRNQHSHIPGYVKAKDARRKRMRTKQDRREDSHREMIRRTREEIKEQARLRQQKHRQAKPKQEPTKEQRAKWAAAKRKQREKK